MTKHWNNCGQLPTCNMQANKPDLHTCLNDEVLPKLQKEQEIAPEVPISMNEKLPPCWVVLHPLTEEQIHQRYPDDSCEEQVNEFDGYAIRQSSLRALPAAANPMFEEYKRRRKKYVNRRNRNFDSFEESESMSQDEFKSSSRGRKRVKRLKKKYEQDSEWSPHTENVSVQHEKRLRRQVRRPIIESSSDDEVFNNWCDSMGDYEYENYFSDSTSQNSVPSKASHDSNVAESLAKANESSDIVSGIIKGMDYPFQKDPNSKTITFVQKTPQNNVKQKAQRGRKRLKVSHNSENEVTSVVTSIVQEMVRTVCSEQIRLEKANNKKNYKKCKWCHTQFSANSANEVMCAICCDLGKDKYLNIPAKKNKSVTKDQTKSVKENRVIKKGNAITQILKNMPKSEKQRLFYTDNKLQTEKGYNHCKSFDVPKGQPPNLNSHMTNLLQEKHLKKPSSENKSTKELKTTHNKVQPEKNKVSTNKKEFLLNFSESANDNINTQTGPKKRGRKPKFNGSSSTHIEKKLAPTGGDKLLHSMAKDDLYQTYLLPPVPTVLVANYTSTADNSGNYLLSSIFYQNEFTQCYEKKSNSTSCIIPSSVNSFSQPVKSVSNIINNSALCITPVCINNVPVNKSEPIVLNNTQLPVVCSVVSLHGQLPNDDNSSIFVDPNFINSEQLSIKITHVSSEINSAENMQSESNQTALSNNSKLNNKLQKNDNSIKTTESTSSKIGLQNHDAEASFKNDEASENTQSKKSPEKHETPKTSFQSAVDLLGAVSILAVIDLEKYPGISLQYRMQAEKNNLAKLKSEKVTSADHEEKIIACSNNLEILEIAKKFLNSFGSFSKVSDHLLRKHKMIQIKKEKIDEDEEETNQSSCRFSQPPLSHNSLNTEISNRTIMPSPSSLTVQMGNLESCALKEQTIPNHIEKLQSQIAAMNNTQINNLPQYDFSNTGTIHHFALEQYDTLTPTMGAPAPVTPRNDTEPREETPSRGSGPRTPARPESATSQPDEQAITAQIKKELMEVGNSTSAVPLYSQNISLTDNTNQPYSVSNSINSLLQNNPPSYTQDCTNFLLNMARNHVSPNITAPLNSNIERNSQLLVRQYAPNAVNHQPNQTVPSINNQYVLRPPASNNNSNRAIMVNNAQVQSMNGLLTNVSNQQFYTSNQVFYNNPTVACIQTNIPPQSGLMAQNQSSPIETPEQMFCAVCKRLATLRCKQCAKVAYCNTTCAKTYWHQKHKMECKPVPS